MNILFDIHRTYLSPGIPADKKAEQKEVQQIKTEWPRYYPSIKNYNQESLDRAKEGWTKTGKTYHLLSKDEKGYPVTHEYPEYFDGENKFIVVKEYKKDTFSIRKVTPVTWVQNTEGFLHFKSSNGHADYQFVDFIDRDFSRDEMLFSFGEKTLKEYFNQFFATEMIVDQRYEKEPPVLTTELANRNYTLKEENNKLKQEKHALETEIEKLKGKLQTMEQEVITQQNKIKRFKEAVENTNVLGLKKLKETAKTL